MFLAIELQTSRVNFLPHAQGLFKPTKHLIRARKIALHREDGVFSWINAPRRSQLCFSHGQRVLVVFCIAQAGPERSHRYTPSG